MRKLVQERKLSRRKLAGQFLYCAADRTRKAQQLSARRALLAANLMPDQLRAAIVLFASLLDERQRRLYAGLESLKCGWGGDARIAGLLGIDPGTVARGRKQLLAEDVERARVRRPGGGRPPLEKNSRGVRCHRKGAAVTELVGRDRTSRQRGAGRRGCPHVLVQEVLESGAAHGPVGGVQEQLRRWVLAADGEPGPEVSGGLFPQRETALTAALAMDSEARSSAQRQICHLRRHQFGHAQSSREAEVEHGAVADAKPSGGVGSVHGRADLVHGQVADVAAGWAATTIHLEVGQESHDERGVEVFEVQLRRSDAEAIGSEDEQQPEGIGVCRISPTGSSPRESVARLTSASVSSGNGRPE